MSILYGFPTLVINNIVSTLLSDDIVTKLMYYLDEGEGVNLLEKPSVENVYTELYKKQLYIHRRLPDILHEAKVYVVVNMSDYRPSQKGSKFIKSTNIRINVICHEKKMYTCHGIRDIVIATRIVDLLENTHTGGIGTMKVVRTVPISGLNKEYTGFEIVLACESIERGK
ncbi:MAG: hypothetical protein ACRDA3_13050 [Peptostreptococcaceae bacterium]